MMQQSRRDFVRTLFVAAQATVVGAVAPADMLAADAPSEGLPFLAMGDWGREGEPHQRAVAAQMAATAAQVQARFILAVGDNFYEDGVKSVNDPQWQSSFEQVYTAKSLQVPWYAVLGNHDYHGNCDAQIEYARTDRRWHMPARYYTRTEVITPGVAADFFFLDTTPMAGWKGGETAFNHRLADQHPAEQVAWLKEQLARSTAPWRIVVGHHPIYSGGEHGDSPYLVEHVLPVLQQYGVQAYINGHDHDLQHLQAGSVNLFCCGAGSTVRPTSVTPHTQFAVSTPGFTALSLGPKELVVRMLDAYGKVLYRTTVSV